MWIRDMIELRLTFGEPVTAGNVTVTPQAYALIIRWRNGAFVWNRPLQIKVERDGQAEYLPVRDVTRIVQVGLLSLALIFSMIALITLRKE